MIADVIRRVAVRHLPDDLAAIEIDRGDRAVGRLEDRHARRRAARRRHRRRRSGAAAAVGRAAPPAREARPPPHAAPRPAPRARGESAAQQSPGPRTSVNGRPAMPETYLMSEKFGGGGTSDPDVMPTLFAFAIRGVRFRIVGDAGPVGAADRVAHVDRAEQAVDAAEHRRVVHPRRHLVALDVLERLRAHLRREVDQIVRHLRGSCARRPAAWSGTAASGSSSRPARRTSAPAALRSATPAARSRDRRRTGTPACQGPRPP